MSPDIQLSIVVVSWNSGEDLPRCLQSVAATASRRDSEAIVIDNASTDGSVDRIRELTSGGQGGTLPVRAVFNTVNRGFAKAANQGMALSTAPYILLLNPDTEVRPGALDTLLASVRQDTRVGACAPRLLKEDGSLQPNVWRNPPTPLSIIVDGLQLYRVLPRRLRGEWLLGRHWDHARRRRVPSFSGAAMMISRRMLEDVGPLDEHFEMYGEDGEWCLRMLRRGWWLMFEPAAEVVHYGGRSARKRWNADERWLREAAAHLTFQVRCLSPLHVAANTMAQIIVLRAVQLKNRTHRNPSSVVSRLLALYRDALREAARRALARPA